MSVGLLYLREGGGAHPVVLHLGEALLFGAQAREVFCHRCDLPPEVCRG